MEEKIIKIERLLNLNHEVFLTPKDMLEVVNLLMEAFTTGTTELSKRIGVIAADVEALDEEDQNITGALDKVKRDLVLLIETAKVDWKSELEKEALRIERLIPTMPDLEPLRDEIRRVEGLIPTIPEAEKAGQIRDKLETLEGDERLDIKAIRGLDDYEEIKRLAREKGMTFHGGGGVGAIKGLVAGEGVQIDNTNPQYPVITASASALNIYSETPAGTIDSSNTDFTTAHAIVTVFSLALNGQFVHPAEYSVLGNVITFVTAPDASLSGLPFTIIYK